MNDTCISILGVQYEIMFKSINDDVSLKNADGYIDNTSKKIVICNKDSDCDLEDFEKYQRKVLRHEIIHGFFYESGLAENVENKAFGVSETMVDWIAIQFPKILDVFKQLDILD